MLVCFIYRGSLNCLSERKKYFGNCAYAISVSGYLASFLWMSNIMTKIIPYVMADTCIMIILKIVKCLVLWSKKLCFWFCQYDLSFNHFTSQFNISNITYDGITIVIILLIQEILLGIWNRIWHRPGFRHFFFFSLDYTVKIHDAFVVVHMFDH